MRFIPNSEASRRQAMLEQIGAPSVEALFERAIPGHLLGKAELSIPPGLSEPEHLERFQAFADANRSFGERCFLGAGAYPHVIPLVADSLIGRGEFFTSYTPYQPEISQGTLQAIFEFQSFITTLSGLDVANASLYDGASASAEAILMAARLQSKGNAGRAGAGKGPERQRILLAQSLQPSYREVVETYTRHLPLQLESVPCDGQSGGIDQEAVAGALDEDVACLVLQSPNFWGVIEDVQAVSALAHRVGALVVVVLTEALSLTVLEPPGALGADIVVGEGQSFGLPLSYGGPYLGFLSCRQAHKRQLPGRLVGQTTDRQGRPGFVLTLSTREQHIRRARATSNICTNQNLTMMLAVMYLTLMGRRGLHEVGLQNLSLQRYFSEQLAARTAFRHRFEGPVFNECLIHGDTPLERVEKRCLDQGMVPGLRVPLPQDEQAGSTSAEGLLVAVTETKSRRTIDALIDALAAA